MATTNEEQQTITIASEDDAFRYLEMALAKKLGDGTFHIEFSNWPTLTIALEGDGYDSTITSRLAEALVELQHAMNRTYARVAHGTGNPNTLTADEKKSIQFKAKVEKGSSLIKVELGDYAEKLAIALAGKMDGTDIVMTVVAMAVLGSSVLAYRAFLQHRSEDKKVDIATQERILLSQEETKRLALLSQAMAAQPRIAATKQDFDDVRHDIVKSVSDAKTLSVQGITLTNSEAKTIAATPRSKAEDVQVNGNYLIHRIDWSKQDEARLSLFSTDESLEFSATLNTGNLSAEHKEKLKASEWDRKRLHLSINATRLRGEITTATIVGVEWPKET